MKQVGQWNFDKHRTEVMEEHLEHSRAHLSRPVPDESVNAVRHRDRTYGKSAKTDVKFDKPLKKRNASSVGIHFLTRANVLTRTGNAERAINTGTTQIFVL